MRNRILVAAFAVLVGCGGNDVTCGDGTTLVDGVCQSTGGSGGGDTCGPGTMESGTTCVPVDGGSGMIAGAPAISDLMVQSTGIAGGGVFEVDGTGFAGDNVTGIQVFFGDPTNVNCLAALYQVAPTQIFGVVPFFCDINVNVSVSTNIGTATTPFHYDGIFAADGDGGGQANFGFGGELWVIDPFTEQAFDFGPLLDSTGEIDYAISGLAFDASGKLWGVTTGNNPDSDTDGVSQLVAIDPETPDQSTVTVVGDLTDGTDGYVVTDIKISNGVMYGWAYDVSGETETQSLVSIDMASGAVTVLGTPVNATFFTGGFSIDDMGTTLVAANSATADSDPQIQTTGELDTADLTTGALTDTGTPLDWAFPSGVESMDFFGTVGLTVGVLDNAVFGAFESDPSAFGETLAIIDPTGPANGGSVVNEVFELPSLSTLSPSAVDGIAIPGSPTAQLQIAHKKLHPAIQLRSHGNGLAKRRTHR